jgi:hypothetical protein
VATDPEYPRALRDGLGAVRVEEKIHHVQHLQRPGVAVAHLVRLLRGQCHGLRASRVTKAPPPRSARARLGGAQLSAAHV